MDKTIPNRIKGNQGTDNPNPLHGQRSSPQVNEDPNISPTDPTHRASVPLYMGTSEPESYSDN